MLRPKAKPLGFLSTRIMWDIYFHQPSLSPNPVSWYKCDLVPNPAAAAADTGWRVFWFFSLFNIAKLDTVTAKLLNKVVKLVRKHDLDLQCSLVPVIYLPHQANTLVSSCVSGD